MARAPRSRTGKRAQERQLRKLVRLKQELAALEPGGSPDRPLAVEVSSVIEGRARAMPCPLCAGSLRIEQHRAEVVDGKSLRQVEVTCLQCGIPRTLWFRIVGTALSS